MGLQYAERRLPLGQRIYFFPVWHHVVTHRFYEKISSFLVGFFFCFYVLQFVSVIAICFCFITIMYSRSFGKYSYSTPRRFSFYLLLTLLIYFLSIFYLPQCNLPNFPSVASLAHLPFLSCCHRTRIIIYQIYISQVDLEPKFRFVIHRNNQ